MQTLLGFTISGYLFVYIKPVFVIVSEKDCRYVIPASSISLNMGYKKKRNKFMHGFIAFTKL